MRRKRRRRGIQSQRIVSSLHVKIKLEVVECGMSLKKDELLDLVDEKDCVVGEVWLSEAHKDLSLIHREIAFVAFTTKGEVLLQQRSLNKKIHPGMWALTAAGHVEKGEKPINTAKREVFEELGIKIDPKYLYKVRITRKKSESRFFHVFYQVLNKKPKVKLDPGEVKQVRWVKLLEIDKFATSQKYPFSESSRKMINRVAKHLKFI